MQKVYQEYLPAVAKALIYGVFLTPLLMSSTFFIYPFVVPKILVFRSLVVLLLVVYILLLFVNWQKFKPRFSLLDMFVGLFLVSYSVSTLVGVDQYLSFWGNLERMFGLLTTLHYVLFYFITKQILTSNKDWKVAFKVFIFSGIITLAIGVVQKAYPNFLFNQGSARVLSTLGNAVYLGGYTIFISFASLLILKKNETTVWKVILVTAIALSCFIAVATGTRSAVGGLVIGLLGLVGGYVIFSSRAYLKKFIIIFLLTATIVGTTIFFLSFKDSNTIKDNVSLNRLFDKAAFYDSFKSRSDVWILSYKIWSERPIFGWGPNNYSLGFNKHYEPGLLRRGYVETWFDNAHNEFLSVLVTQGLVGLFFYIGIFVVAFKSLVRTHKSNAISKHDLIVILAFFLAHIFYLQFIFENFTSLLCLMFWLALVSFNSQKAQLPYLQEIRDKLGIGQTSKAISTKQLSVVTSSLLVISGFFIFYSNIEPAISNIKTFRAVESFLQTRSVTTEVGLLEQALARKTPYIFDLTNEVTKSVGPVISKRLHFLPRSVVSSSLNLLITKQTDNTKIHPLDPRIFMALAKLWQINFLFTNNRDHLLESEMLLEQAIKLSPKRQQIFFLLADLRFSLNKKDEGIDAFEQAYHLDPIVGESVWRLAWAYFVVGKIEESCAIISKGKAQGAHYSYGQLGLEIITPILAECEQITKQ